MQKLLAEEMIQLQSQIQSLQVDNQKTTQEKVALEDKIQSLHKELSQLHDKQTEQQKIAESQIKELSELNDKLKQEKEDGQTELQNAKHEAFTEKEQLHNLQLKIESLTQENGKLVVEVGETRDSYQAERQQMEEQISSLRELLKSQKVTSVQDQLFTCFRKKNLYKR